MSDYKPVAVIPHYNHSDTLAGVVRQLLVMEVPLIIVDDGSSPHHVARLKFLERQRHPQSVSIIYCPHNNGKGAALKIAFKEALARGFTHALQVDADGQHHLPDARLMLEKSRGNPTALICGRPIYGADAPKARLYGRKITDFWNAVNTLSLDIRDGMCGFRLYPLAFTVAVLNQERVGDRMDFDTEILIRMHWRHVPMIWQDTPVRYRQGGVSHFRSVADNWLISKMHARLFLGMLKRVLTGKGV